MDIIKEKMYKKYLSILFIFILIFVGCSHSQINVPKKKDKGNVIISLKNSNITLYKHITMANYFSFNIISDKALDNNVSLSIDIKTPYKLFIDKMKTEQMPYYVFQNYQKVDWKKMHDLEAKAIVNGEPKLGSNELKEFSQYRDMYIDDYKKEIQKNNYKDYYYYTATINFDMSNSDVSENEVFQNITLKVDKEEYKFNIGKVELNYSQKLENIGTELESQTLAVSDKKIIPGAQGNIVIDDAKFICKKDLQINGFRILNSNVDIKEISLITEENDKTFDNKITNNQHISCKKDTTIIPKIKLADKNFMNKQLYSTIVYMIVDYEVDGKKYSANFEAGYRTRSEFYELIAVENDNIDFLPFYNDYYNYNLAKGE